MYKSKLENYNFATLLRLQCDGDYTPENTTIAPKIQFYAIEIARNREGFNDVIRKNVKFAGNTDDNSIKNHHQ